MLVIQAAAGIRRVPKALLHVFSYPPIVAGLLVGCVVLVAATAAAATAGAIAAPPWLLQPRWLVVEVAAAAVVAITTAAAAAAAAAVPMLLLLMPPMLFSTLVLLLPYTLLLRRPPLLPLGFVQLALLLQLGCPFRVGLGHVGCGPRCTRTYEVPRVLDDDRTVGTSF